MSYILTLSDYSSTKKLISLIRDLDQKLINDEIFEKLISEFLNKQQNINDKYLTIRHLLQLYPNNKFLGEFKNKINDPLILSEQEIQKNQTIYYYNEQLNKIRQDNDWKKFNRLLEDDKFYEICQYPLSLKKTKPIIEKLQHHCFKLIDLIETCKDSNFQLNYSVLKNLLFFFFLPDELQINNVELIELQQLLGEILCECWVQFEYYLQQLRSQSKIQEHQQMQQQLPKFIQGDQKILKDTIEQTFRSLINIPTAILTFQDIDNIILNLLPVNLELQQIFYQICLFCFSSFNQQYEKNKQSLTQIDNKQLQLLNLYIQEKQQSSQYQIQNHQLVSQLRVYTLIQNAYICEQNKQNVQLQKKINIFQIRNYIFLIQIINMQNSQIYSLIYLKKIIERWLAVLLQSLIQEQSQIKIIQQLQQLNNNYPIKELEIIFRLVCEVQKQDFSKFLILKQLILDDKSKSKMKQIENPFLTSKFFDQQLKSDIYPRDLNITLEEFNISLTLLDKVQQQQLVKNWINNLKDSDNFKQLIPFFFNIIKRGESSASFLSIINQQIKAKSDLLGTYGFFNQKTIFQIFYNNANDELKVMLLKLMSKQYPIPLLYRTPYNAKTGEAEKLTFNINTFYVYQENYPIINISFNENQKRIGKTQLINKIFYQVDKFEISDSNQLNKQTIDIMYDFEFSGSRNLSIADAHGFIPYEILDDILPMFKLWIVQVDGEQEIDNTIQALNQLKTFQNKDKTICFLIRNSNQEELNHKQQQQLNDFNIQYKQVMNLSDNDLNKQMMDDEIEQVSKFLFDIIDQNRMQNTLNQEQYLHLICQMKNQNLDQTIEIQESLQLFQEIETELERQMKHKDGFYNGDSFPLRSIDWNIKQEKESYIRVQQDKDDKLKQDKLSQINKTIETLKQQIKSQQPTKILIKFCSLLEKPNYYILYLYFVDKIRRFNEKNTYNLQIENQKLKVAILALKKEKESLKAKEQNTAMTIEQMEQRERKQQQIDQKILEIQQNSEIIVKRNIGIELFWREIISQREVCVNSQIEIDPAKIVKEMILKGEPFEFLEGDTLRINQSFLIQLISNFNNQGQEKILVLSVLGPQGSGKSSLLNKMFGCHFNSDIKNPTKGIYLQLLKIHNKEYFNNQFDYLIILDSEGLQSLNQEDQEFDKKIALFVLSISDIILVNVKGDITKEFKSFVEMCIFTLGSMKSFSSSKQIKWCFNQNNDVNNYAPFTAQLQSIASSLNIELSNQRDAEVTIDYNDILGLTQENIKILGFASTEKLWRKNENNGIYQDWRQLIINGTFSEEAYLYGIKVIKSYVDKFGIENDQNDKKMEDLKFFIQKIETTWQSICSLPDLLEFSELIQHQQNQFMRQQFKLIMSSHVFPIKATYIQEIHDLIKNNYKLTFETLNDIYNHQIISMKVKFNQLKIEITDKLTSIKNEKKISKKVFKKYMTMVKDRINSEISAFSLDIYSEIKTLETSLQKKKGFFQFDLFILKLLANEEEFQKYKSSEDLIKTKFEEIWGSILNQHVEQQEEMFKENCDKLLITIQQEFPKYILKTSREEDYKQQFLQYLIKITPCQQDYLKQLEILYPELTPQQFMIAERTQKTYQFYENFIQNVEKRISDSSNKQQILQIGQFYQYKISIKWIIQEDIYKYMQTEMTADVENLFKTKKIEDKQMLQNFLQYFTIFGFDIDQENIVQLYQELNSWFFRNTKQYLLQCFIPTIRNYGDQTNYDLSVEFIKRTYRNIQKYFQTIEMAIPLSDVSELNNLLNIYNQSDKFLVDLQKTVITHQNLEYIISKNSQQYQTKEQQINLLSQHKRPINQVSTSSKNKSLIKVVFDYIQNQKTFSHQQNQFKSNIVSTIQQLMNDEQNRGWNQMYSQIHEMILNEIINNKQNSMIQEIQDVEVNQYSFCLIKRIMQKIEVEIKDFNLQFCKFGVILNDVGERCLFYYAIFTIWRILCFGQWKSTELNINELKNQKQELYIQFKRDIQQNKKEQSKIRGQILSTEIITLAIQRFYIEYSKQAKKILTDYSQESSYDIIYNLDKEILEKQNKNITDSQILEYIRNQTNYIKKYVKHKNLDKMSFMSKSNQLNRDKGKNSNRRMCSIVNEISIINSFIISLFIFKKRFIFFSFNFNQFSYILPNIEENVILLKQNNV